MPSLACLSNSSGRGLTGGSFINSVEERTTRSLRRTLDKAGYYCQEKFILPHGTLGDSRSDFKVMGTLA
jgi:hypothetical protein